MTRPASDGYLRPDLRVYSFVARDGRVVEYGGRLDHDVETLEEDYSAVSTPERFDQLPDVAEAIIAHLVEQFDVTVCEESEPRAIPPFAAPDRRVTLAPADRRGAALAFEFRGSEVILRCGSRDETRVPSCMCDACDESAVTEAGDLERHAFAVVDGHFQEKVTGRRRLSVQITFNVPGRWHESGGPVALEPDEADGFREVQRRLDEIGGVWHPWPRRVVGVAD